MLNSGGYIVYSLNSTRQQSIEVYRNNNYYFWIYFIPWGLWKERFSLSAWCHWLWNIFHSLWSLIIDIISQCVMPLTVKYISFFEVFENRDSLSVHDGIDCKILLIIWGLWKRDFVSEHDAFDCKINLIFWVLNSLKSLKKRFSPGA